MQQNQARQVKAKKQRRKNKTSEEEGSVTEDAEGIAEARANITQQSVITEDGIIHETLLTQGKRKYQKDGLQRWLHLRSTYKGTTGRKKVYIHR